MAKPSTPDTDQETLCSQIVGLNDRTLRKSYFPQLKQQIEELKQARKAEQEKAAALEASLQKLRQSRIETEASEKKFRLLADYTNDIEYWVGTDGRIVYISPSCEWQTGYSQKEFEDDPDLLCKIIHPDDRPLIEVHNIQDAIFETHSVDLRLITRQGQIRWFAHQCRSIFAEDGQWLGRRGSNRDITKRKIAEANALRLSNLYAALSQCNEAIVRSRSEQELFPRICRSAVELGGVKIAWVGTFDPSTQRIRCVASYGDETGFLDQADLALEALDKRSPIRILLDTGQSVWLQDIHSDPAPEAFLAWADHAGINSSATLLLQRKGVPVGCFTLFSDSSYIFDDRARQLLTEMAMDMSFALSNFALENDRLQAQQQVQSYLAQLESAFMHTVMMAMNLSELRDPYTAGHERRVGLIAKAIATEMGLDEKTVQGTEIAGYLHDLGKITIPAEILSRPGKLTKLEYLLIREHVQASYNILSSTDFPWPVADVVLQHHERMDGSGYPQGLKGEQISLQARILALADVVEAIASHRPYRPCKGIEAALAEIESGCGKLYDPEVVAACLRLFREKGFPLPL
jgi:PAS domain S-box-containing protein/putative nucleotidyltransferase with HDIG domain